jgi:hypothetical protein
VTGEARASSPVLSYPITVDERRNRAVKKAEIISCVSSYNCEHYIIDLLESIKEQLLSDDSHGKLFLITVEEVENIDINH